jgi:hypothetical protein
MPVSVEGRSRRDCGLRPRTRRNIPSFANFIGRTFRPALLDPVDPVFIARSAGLSLSLRHSSLGQSLVLSGKYTIDVADDHVIVDNNGVGMVDETVLNNTWY